MHVLLSDALTCPRCGPEYPLLLLVDVVTNRRVLEGSLGCMNCRERYLIRGGFCDLAGNEITKSRNYEITTEGSTNDNGLRLAASLGITEGPALVLLVGPAAMHAAEINQLIPSLEIAAAWGPLEQAAESEGISRFAVGEQLPFRDGSMRAVVLSGDDALTLIGEGVRVAAPRANVVVLANGEEAARRMSDAGLKLLAKDEHAAVAQRVLAK